jgi:predicted amidophosphoribosyltransferase
MAQAVAEALGCASAEALAFNAERGGSFPKKSARLQPFRVTQMVEGPVLLIDDVASSGRHLQLAHRALTNNGLNVVAMAWIGP